MIAKVQNYIDEQRSIGATITVVSPKPLNIDISLKVTKGSGNIDGIKNAVNDFLKQLHLIVNTYLMHRSAKLYWKNGDRRTRL